MSELALDSNQCSWLCECALEMLQGLFLLLFVCFFSFLGWGGWYFCSQNLLVNWSFLISKPDEPRLLAYLVVNNEARTQAVHHYLLFQLIFLYAFSFIIDKQSFWEKEKVNQYKRGRKKREQETNQGVGGWGIRHQGGAIALLPSSSLLLWQRDLWTSMHWDGFKHA